MAIWYLVVLSMCQACSPIPDTDRGLVVDLTASEGGDGSECLPFASLDAALQLSATSLHLSILMRPSDREGSISLIASIANTVRVTGSNSTVVLTGRLLISGVMVLSSLSLRDGGSTTGAMVSLQGGLFDLRDSQATGNSRSLVEAFQGSVSVSNSSLRGFPNAAFVIYSSLVQVLISDTSFSRNQDLIEVNVRTGEGSGLITLQDADIQLCGRVISSRNNQLGSFTVEMRNVTVLHAPLGLLLGDVHNFTVRIDRVNVTDALSLVSGSVINTTISVQNSVLSQIGKAVFDLSALRGFVQVKNCTISNVAGGPVIQLPVNLNPASSAVIEVTESRVQNVRNSLSMGIVFCCSAATVAISSSEISNSSMIEGGLFLVTAGVVNLRDVYYHDSQAFLAPFFEAVASVVVCVNVHVQRIFIESSFISSCTFGSNCEWRNVSITDTTKPPETFGFVLILVGFSGTAVFRDCYFRNGKQQSILAAGSSNEGILQIYDSVFEDLNNVETFGAYVESFVLMRNVTLINPQVEILFSCVFTENCFQVSDISIVGTAKIALVLRSNGGKAVIDNTSFSGLSNNAIIASNADITLSRVNISHFNGVVCKNCINCRLLLSSFVLEDIIAAVVFDLSYGSMIWNQSLVRNVQCEQFVILDNSEMKIINGVFEDMSVNSFGGMVSATSSHLYFDSAVIRRISSTLSIYIGLFYLEGSSVEIENSEVSNFHSTLIATISARQVVLRNSQFWNDEWEETSQHVKQRGSVLLSRYSLEVTITACTFQNLRADDGGVCYLIGSGVETCSIAHTTARWNRANADGGVVFADLVNLSITDSNFSHNTAVRGGALLVVGSSGEARSTIERCQFTNNSAAQSGGVLQQLKSASEVRDCRWSNNTAVYGPDIAAEVSFLSIIDPQTLHPILNYSLDAVSGRGLNEEIVIGCMDSLGQIVSSDSSSKLSLFTREENSSIITSSLLVSSMGIFRIPTMTIIGQPNTTVAIAGTFRADLTQELFTVRLRVCVPGEFFSDLQCKMCSHNTYSLNPSQPCTLCPVYADCPLGSQMSLHEGYWRRDNLTKEVYNCIVPELCKGGLNSDCAEGHSGPLCTQCLDNYYKVNQLQCASCGSSAIARLKGVAALLIAVATAAYCLRWKEKLLLLHMVVVDFLQFTHILLNLSIYWPEPIALLFSAMGSLGSVGLATFTDPCIGQIPGISIIHSQLTLMGFYQALIGAAIIGIGFYVIPLFKPIKLHTTIKFAFYMYYLTLPMIYQRAMQLLVCFELEESRLLYDPSVECWTKGHLAVALPVFLCACVLCVLVPLLSLPMKEKQRWCDVMRQDESYYWLVLLLRKYILTTVLLCSPQLSMTTQVSLILLFNVTTETITRNHRLSRKALYYNIYQCTLAVSSAMTFCCVLYSASRSTGSAYYFVAVIYALFLSPWAYGLRKICSAGKLPQVVSLVGNAVNEPQDFSTIDPQGIMLENDPDLTEGHLVPPPTTPEPS